MRTLFWFIVLLVNLGIVLSLTSSLLYGETIIILVFSLFISISILLLMVRMQKLPLWTYNLMQFLCVSIPVLGFIGSIDYGTFSGLEIASIGFFILLGWSSWMSFIFFYQPNTYTKNTY